eukprot:5002421-Ditylum_brightwellii.AAC.1
MEWALRGVSRVIGGCGLVGKNYRMCATPHTGGTHCKQTMMRHHVRTIFGLSCVALQQEPLPAC